MRKLNFIHCGVTLTGTFIFLTAFTRGKGPIWFCVGALLIVVGLFNVIIKIKEVSNSRYKKTNQIDAKDERSTLIKSKAKALTYDITIFIINLCVLYFVFIDKTGIVLLLIGVIILQLIISAISKIYYNKIL